MHHITDRMVHQTKRTCTRTTKKTTPTMRAKFELNQSTIDFRQPCTTRTSIICIQLSRHFQLASARNRLSILRSTRTALSRAHTSDNAADPENCYRIVKQTPGKRYPSVAGYYLAPAYKPNVTRCRSAPTNRNHNPTLHYYLFYLFIYT